MVATRAPNHRIWPLLGLTCAMITLAGCGQRGALYMPDRNARVVTRPAASSAPSSAPAKSSTSSAPAAASPGR